MPHLKWSDEAVRGVQRAYRFLAAKDAAAAMAAARTIKKHAAVPAKFPEAGKPAEDLDPEHRELTIPFGAMGYTLVYEVHPDSILILAVKHQREAGY